MGGTRLNKSRLPKMEQQLPLIPLFVQQIFIVHCAPGSVLGNSEYNEKTVSLCSHRALWYQKIYSSSNIHAFVPLHFLFCLPRMLFPPLIRYYFLPLNTQLRWYYYLWEDSSDSKPQTELIPLYVTFIFFFIIYNMYNKHAIALLSEKNGVVFLKEQIWMMPVWCLNFKLDSFFFVFSRDFLLLNFR